MNKMPHIQLDHSISASSAILPGDPARVDAIAEFLTDVRFETFSREYKSITGSYKGVRILAISTGMGGPSTAICVEELADIGIKNIIRIGSCGALQQELEPGQLVICDRAVCDDGTSQTYLDYFRYASPAYSGGSAPALLANARAAGFHESAASSLTNTSKASSICFAYADRTLQNACEAAAEEFGFSYATGATRCHDALYLKQKPQLDEFYSKRGILASDMETAAVFAVSTLRGVRAASILNVVVEWKKTIAKGVSSYREGAAAAIQGEKNEILTALEALRRMKP